MLSSNSGKEIESCFDLLVFGQIRLQYLLGIFNFGFVTGLALGPPGLQRRRTFKSASRTTSYPFVTPDTPSSHTPSSAPIQGMQQNNLNKQLFQLEFQLEFLKNEEFRCRLQSSDCTNKKQRQRALMVLIREDYKFLQYP